MWRRMGAVDGGLALLPYGGRLCLSCEEQWMGVWVGAVEDLVGQKHHQDGGYGRRPGVPLSEQAGDALVELPHGILEEAVEHDGLPRALAGSNM